MRLARLLLLAVFAIWAGTGMPPGIAPTAFAQEAAVAPDYAAWEKDAANAEDVISAARASPGSSKAPTWRR